MLVDAPAVSHLITITVIDNPFEADEMARPARRVVSLDGWGRSLGELLPEQVRRDPSWLVIEDGKIVPREEWARLCAPGAELICVSQPGDAAARIIAGVVIIAASLMIGDISGTGATFGFTLIGVSTGAGLAVGGIAELIIGPPRIPALSFSQGDQAGSATYGFDGIRNTTRIGSPIPVVYGTHRVGGIYLSLSVRADVTLISPVATGTINVTKVSAAGLQIDGSGTNFLSTLAVGRYIRWTSNTFSSSGVEFLSQIESVSSNILATASVPMSRKFPTPLAIGVAWNVVVNAPTNAGSEVIYGLIGLSEGEITAISDIQINNQPAANFREVQTETRLGLNAQNTITFFGDSTATTIAADAAISETFTTYTTTGRDLTGYEINLAFPQGLYSIDANGALGTALVDTEIRHKLTSAGSYGGVITYSVLDGKRSVIRRTVRVEGLAPGQYDIQVRRITPESTSLTKVDALRRSSVNEMINEAYTYPNTALLAVKALATDQLSGVPTITSLVQGVKIKVFSSATAFSVAYTNNPAWAVFDILTSERYGHGFFTWPAQLSGSWGFSNASPTVTGSGFTNKIRKGQKILVWLTATTGAIYTVSAPVNDTSFTLTENPTGVTLSQAFTSATLTVNSVGWQPVMDVEYSDDGETWGTAYSGWSLSGNASSTITWEPVGHRRYWRIRRVNAATTSGPWAHELAFSGFATPVRLFNQASGWSVSGFTLGDAAIIHDGVTSFQMSFHGDSSVLNSWLRLDTWSGFTTASYAAEAHRNDLDLQSFVDWAAFCDVLVSDGSGGTEKRATVDIVFDADSTKLWDAVIKICGIGFAIPIKLGNYIRIKFQAAESPVQLFTMANIIRDSFQEMFLSLKERANSFEVSYLNAANNYEQEMITLTDPVLFTNVEPERKQTVSAFGVTRSGHAARLARFYQNANRLITRMITFGAALDAIRCEPGDVIRFQHDVPGWGLLGTRAAAGATSGTFKIDREVTLEAATTYEALVRHVDDSVETRTITTAAGTYPAGTALTISGTWTALPVDGEVMAIGVISISTKPFRIIAIQRATELTATITAIEYNAAVYDETGLTPVNVTQFSTLPDASGPPPHVTDLALAQLSDEQHTVQVSFQPPTDSRYDHADIYSILAGVPYKLGESRWGNFAIPGVAAGVTITIRVVSVSRLGVAANVLTAPEASMIVATPDRPPRVSGLELVGQGNDTAFVGRDAKFGWRHRAVTAGFGTDPLGLESLGFGAGVTAARFKQYRVEIYNVGGTILRRREHVLDPFFTYSYEKNFEDGIAGGAGVQRSFTIYIWEQDSFNQLSPLPAVLTVSNVAPGLLADVSITALSTSILLSWEKSAELDVAGYKIWMSMTNGFTPAESNVAARVGHPGTTMLAENVSAGTTYYFRVAAFDAFGEDGLNLSGQFSAVTQGRAIDILSSLPSLPNAAYPAGAVVFLLANYQLYRSTGTAWVSAVPAADLTGTIASTQISDGAITTPKLAANSVTAANIVAGIITADKFQTTLGQDLSQAMAYTDAMLAGTADFFTTLTNTQVDAGTFAGLERDRWYLTPWLGRVMTRTWDDAGGAWWDQGGLGWDVPVNVTAGSWTSDGTTDMLSNQTGKAEVWIEKSTPNGESPAPTVVVEAQFKASGGADFGITGPGYIDGGWTTFADNGVIGGVKNQYVSAVFTGVRYVRTRITLTPGASTLSVIAKDPEIRFNDTRIPADKLHAGTGVNGYLLMHDSAVLGGMRWTAPGIASHGPSGYNVAVTTAATSHTVSGLSQPSTSYAPLVQTSWNTAWWVEDADKTTTQFIARFSNPAPAGATLSYVIHE